MNGEDQQIAEAVPTGRARSLANLTGGSRKGSPNKTTVLAKTAISEAFEKLGGIKALVTWAEKSDDNRKIFYSQIWPKIIPLQVTGEDGGPIQAAVAVTFCKADHAAD